MMGASVPFFISSGKNARRSVAISLNNERALLPNQNIFVLKRQKALTLQIQL